MSSLQNLLTFFQQIISAYLRITRCKFKRIVNDVVSFEQLGPEITLEPRLSKERTAKTLKCLEVSFSSDFYKRTRN